MSEIASPSSLEVPFRLPTWFPDLPRETMERFRVYMDELVKFNKALNLVSPKTIMFADAIHFADCILASRYIYSDNKDIREIYDFGSGNGFPGIVFAILYPSIKVVCVDSDQRKCEFMKHVAAQLILKNIEVKNNTVESLPADSVRFAMSRGFASISKAVLAARRPMVKDGALYHMKGDNWAAEIADIPTQLCSVWSPALVREYRLPIGEFAFAVVKTNKIA